MPGKVLQPMSKRLRRCLRSRIREIRTSLLSPSAPLQARRWLSNQRVPLPGSKPTSQLLLRPISRHHRGLRPQVKTRVRITWTIPLKSGLLSGSTTHQSMASDISSQTSALVYSSTIRPRWSLSLQAPSSTTMSVKPSRATKSKTCSLNTALPTFPKSYRRRLLCSSTSSHTLSKTMIQWKRSS